MQQKEFELSIRQVVPFTGVLNMVIENGEASKMNFHGIRFTGRLMADGATAAEKYNSGLITLMCIPNDKIAIPNLQTEADLNDSNSFIIACIPWETHVRATAEQTNLGYGATFDWEIAPKTSRSCMRGGKIVAQVSNNSAAGDVIVTDLLSTFESV